MYKYSSVQVFKLGQWDRLVAPGVQVSTGVDMCTSVYKCTSVYNWESGVKVVLTLTGCTRYLLLAGKCKVARHIKIWVALYGVRCNHVDLPDRVKS